LLIRLAIKTLASDRGKLIAGIIGVTISVVLANVQGGLFLGLIGKASILVNRGQADIWVGYKGMHNVDFPHDIPKRWLDRIRGIDGVEQAIPLSIGFSDMTLPDGSFESVVVIGAERDEKMGRFWDTPGANCPELTQDDGIIVDDCDAYKLASPQIGEYREIGGLRSRVVGHCHGVLSFLVAPYVFTSLERAARFTGKAPEDCSYFLVRVAPDTDPKKVCDEINARLPYAEAMSASKYAAISVDFWMTRTGIGISFGAATMLGLLVGLAMVAQILYAMVLDRISEFATLKALGAREWEIVMILLGQATGIAVCGISIGLAITWFIRSNYDSPRAPINIPLELICLSSLCIYLMCILASSVPYIRIRSVDAHTVLQG
jgi:putative ABC transport system permease protein